MSKCKTQGAWGGRLYSTTPRITQLCAALGILFHLSSEAGRAHPKASTKHKASHFNTSTKVRVWCILGESFTAGQVKDHFVLKNVKLHSIHKHFSAWTNDHFNWSNQQMHIGGFWTSDQYLMKGETRGYTKKMHRMGGSGYERKCRRVWDGVTTFGEKVASLPLCPCGLTFCCCYESKQNKKRTVGDKKEKQLKT